MKKIFFIICVLCFVCQLCAQKRPTIDRSRFEISSKSVDFSERGGEKCITVTSDKTWSIQRIPAPWVTLTRNNNALMLKVGENTMSQRSSSFIIASMGRNIEVRITQSASSILEASTESVNFGSQGGSESINIKTYKPWNIGTHTVPWVNLSKNDNTLTLKVDANTKNSSKKGYVTIVSGNKSIKINISQSAVEQKFLIYPSSATFSANGREKSFIVTSTHAWRIVEPTESWCSFKRNGNRLTLIVGPNTDIKSRSCNIFLKSGTKSICVNISQAGATPNIDISSRWEKFSAKGGSRILTVTSDYEWYIDTQIPAWVHLKKNGNSLTLMVDANTETTSRCGYFTLKSGNKSIRVDISQTGVMSMFSISSTSERFGANGGYRTFTVNSSENWQIDTQVSSWGHLTKNGNSLTLNIDANTETVSRESFFVIRSGNKTIRVNILQEACVPYLIVNASADKVFLNYKSANSLRNINVRTNADKFDILRMPSWCYVKNRTANDFMLGCFRNKSSHPRSGNIEITTGIKTVVVHVQQEYDLKKYYRRRNGGWINMALGCEGGYGLGCDVSWYVNGIIGMRIGNYKDVLQFETGICPGVIYNSQSESTFHLPIYGSLKLSTKSGKFYLKIGGAYNVIRDDNYEGCYSLRTGVGSAWKHFEWDWTYVQFNSSADYYDSKGIFDKSNMIIGMRMAWYITR